MDNLYDNDQPELNIEQMDPSALTKPARAPVRARPASGMTDAVRRVIEWHHARTTKPTSDALISRPAARGNAGNEEMPASLGIPGLP
jgi:hypothetical protein